MATATLRIDETEWKWDDEEYEWFCAFPNGASARVIPPVGQEVAFLARLSNPHWIAATLYIDDVHWIYNGQRWLRSIAIWRVEVGYDHNARRWFAAAHKYGEASTTLQERHLVAALIEAARWASTLWNARFWGWKWDDQENGYILSRDGRRLYIHWGHGLWWLKIHVGDDTKNVAIEQRDPRDAARWVESWIDLLS